jgi:uncharacterized protein involved in outer membrane biogenesis
MAKDDSVPSPPKRRRRWPVVAVAVILAIGAFLVSLPLFVDWYATRWLHERGLIEASIEDVDIDLFTGRVGLDGVVLTDDESGRTRSTRTFFDFEWQGLFRKRVLIGRIELSDAEITVVRDEAKDVFIADFLLTGGDTAEAAPVDEEPSSFGFGITEIDIRNVLVHYRGAFFEQDVLFEELSVGRLATWDAEQSTAMTLRAKIEGRTHTISGDIMPLAEVPVVDLTVDLNELDLAPFEQMLANQGVGTPGGILSIDARVQAKIGTEPEPMTVDFDGSVSIEGAAMALETFVLQRGNVAWAGQLNTVQTADSTAVTVNGKLDVSSFSAALPEADDVATTSAAETETAGSNVPEIVAENTIPAATEGQTAVGPAPIGEAGASIVSLARLELELRDLQFEQAADASAIRLASVLAIEDFEADTPAAKARLGGISFDGDLNLDLAGDTPAGTISGGLGVTALAADTESGNLAVKQLDLADTRVTLGGGTPDRVAVNSRINATGMSFDDGDASAVVDTLAWAGEVDLATAGDAPVGSVGGKLEVDGVAARVVSSGIDAGLGSADWDGSARLTDDDGGIRFGDGRIELASVAVTLLEPTLELARVQAMTAALHEADEGDMLSIANVGLDTVALLQRPTPADGEATHVVAFDRLDLDRLVVAADRTAVGQVEIDGLATWFAVGPDGFEATAITANLGGGDEATADGTAAAASDAGSSSTFRIESFSTRNPGSMKFIDRTVRPPVELDFDELNFAMGTLDSATPDVAMPLAFGASIGRYTKISFDGTVTPLAEKLSLGGQAKVESLNMPWLAGYQAKTIGYVANSGSLSADVDVKVEQDMIDSKAELVVRQLELERVVAEEDDEFTADLGVPMGKALDLLKDKNGEIRLDVPIEGDVNELSVGVGDALRKVWAKGLKVAMTHAATSFFGPLLPAVAIVKVVGMANKIRFEPVAFNAASVELPADQASYLDEMVEILNGRPNVDVVLCGIGVPADIPPPVGESAQPAADGAGKDGDQAASDEATPADPTEALLELGRERQLVVKDYLVDHGVAAERLVICTPEIDDSPDAQPRVELGV